MPKPSSNVAVRLARLCELFNRAAGAAYRVEPCPNPAEAGTTLLIAGWALAGGEDEARQRAADLIGRLYGAETEIESLCGEILDRYEEAALVHRLSQRLGDVQAEAQVAEITLEEALSTLGAREGEMWLTDGQTVVLAAGLPRDGSRPGTLREQGPLAALKERRSWIREASSDAEAVVAVPIPDGGAEALGVLVLRGRSGERSFRAAEIKLLAAVAGLASAFIRNQRLAPRVKRS